MKFMFTFGLGYDLGYNYVVVEADNEEHARQIFVTERAKITEGLDAPEFRWSSCYEYDQTLIDRYGWTEVPIDTPINLR